jgi:hypothetical protein
MSTLSEHTRNGNSTATRLQREDTKAQLDGVLQHFDVLPSRFDRFLFKYIYVYLLGLFVLGELVLIIYYLIGNWPVGEFLATAVGINVPPLVVIIVVIWRFNVWRVRAPHTLRDLIEQKRIALPDGDADASYLRFLGHYRAALASPKRYVLSGFLMLIYGLLTAYDIIQYLSSGMPTNLATLQVVHHLLFGFLYVGAFYGAGIVIWAIYVSGWYVRKLVRAFQLSIDPFHPDECGGLRLLGNFCFGLGSPLLIASGILIGSIIFSLVEYATTLYRSETSNVYYLAADVGLPLLFVLLFFLPGIVLDFILPLRDIHRKMVSERKTNENSYFTRTKALREQIQALLAAHQVEAAKAVQEEKTLMETLYAPYPTWPFHVRSKISSTVLEVGGSLLIGLITAALVQYFLPVMLTLFLHTP